MTKEVMKLPLSEQLRQIPDDIRIGISTKNAIGCNDTTWISVGALCHEAAEALAKQEQDEPVAYFNPQKGGFYWAKPTKIEAPVSVDVEPLPLYTTPQGCDECGVGGGYALYCLACAEKFFGNKEWVGLTSEDIYACDEQSKLPKYEITNADLQAFAYAIEAKLREKNT